MIALLCSANEPYIPRIRPYLASLERHLKGTGITPVLVAVDTEAHWDLPVQCVSQDTASLPYAPPLSHLQAGGFLDAFPGDDDDVLVFTDGDIVMQRPPSAAEIEWLRTWPADAVGLGYNAGPEDSLYNEWWRLEPRTFPTPDNVAAFPSIPCLNTGVAIARRATWRRWYAATAQQYPALDRLLGHYAKQQWTMNLARHALGLPLIILPQTIHTHGCYALPHGCAMDDDGRLTYLGTPVLFRHHI